MEPPPTKGARGHVVAVVVPSGLAGPGSYDQARYHAKRRANLLKCVGPEFAQCEHMHYVPNRLSPRPNQTDFPAVPLILKNQARHTNQCLTQFLLWVEVFFKRQPNSHDQAARPRTAEGCWSSAGRAFARVGRRGCHGAGSVQGNIKLTNS